MDQFTMQFIMVMGMIRVSVSLGRIAEALPPRGLISKTFAD